ncbi:MAG: pilin [Patescibacteria group bacterium]|nr:pilin [Patescibacteria group bacterium]
MRRLLAVIAIAWLLLVPTAGIVWAQTNTNAATLLKPTLSIPIPTVTFSDIVGKGGETVTIPWIAEYIYGLYQYALGAGLLIAAVMMTIGGFEWLVGRPQQGKTRITDAVLGLFVLLASYIILNAVNPSLTSLQGILIRTVPQKKIEIVSGAMIAAVTGAAPVNKAEMIRQAMDKAKALGGDDFACFVRASMEHESGGRQNALGHDENATSTNFSVEMRRKFQNSGAKYSDLQKDPTGKTQSFDPIGCNSMACQNKGPLNDDTVNLQAPPDYGLDWRFSHGIGSGQSTVFPNSAPCSGKADQGRGFRTGNKCYTIPELFDVNKQIDAMLDHYKACWGKTNNGSDPAAGYVCYAGKIAKDNPIIVSRVDSYNKCRTATP